MKNIDYETYFSSTAKNDRQYSNTQCKVPCGKVCFLLDVGEPYNTI